MEPARAPPRMGVSSARIGSRATHSQALLRARRTHSTLLLCTSHQTAQHDARTSWDERAARRHEAFLPSAPGLTTHVKLTSNACMRPRGGLAVSARAGARR